LKLDGCIIKEQMHYIKADCGGGGVCVTGVLVKSDEVMESFCKS